jgi:putative peptidoglycan lipid II flippase
MVKTSSMVDAKATAQQAQPTRRSGSRNALTLMIGTLASRVTGLLRQSLLNQLFPVAIVDAFAVALKVPNLFRELLAEGALTNAFVPAYKTLDRQEARRLSGALFSLLLLVNTLLVLVAVLAAPWIVQILLAGGTVDYDLTVRLTRIVFPFLAAISFSALAMGILQAEERFFAPAWAPVMLNVVTVILMLFFPGHAEMLAVAFVVGGAVQFLFQVPFLVKHGYVPKLGSWWQPALGGILLLMVPFTFTTGARQFLNVIATRLLDLLPAGSQVAFMNADTFLSLALGLFSISPTLAYYSRLSADAIENPAAFKHTLLAGLRFITFLTVPAGLLLMFLAEPAVQVVFNWLPVLNLGRGADPQLLALSIAATVPLGLAIFPLGLNTLLIRTFYIRRNVRLPITIVVTSVSVNALLYWLLAVPYGIAGLSIATALVAWAQLVTLLLLVARREGLELLTFIGHAAKVWGAAGLAAGVMMLALTVLPGVPGWWGYVLQAVVGAVVFGVAYALAGVLLKLPELQSVARRFKG